MNLGILGAGAEGSGLSALLAGEDGVERLALADVDARPAGAGGRRACAELDTGCRAEATVLDAADSELVGEWARVSTRSSTRRCRT